jgi:hypothetical protein
MASTDFQQNQENWVLRSLRRLDPGGAYWRYSAYVSVIVAFAAIGGYASAALLTHSTSNYLGALYAGILTCLSMLFLRPTATRYPFKEIAVATTAILIGAGIGGAIGHIPKVAEPLTVVFAFTGFYVRRWPEPMPMAGFVLVLSFIISQILAPVAPPGVVHAGMLSLILFVSIGFWFVPRTAFTHAFISTVVRMRAALPGEISAHPNNTNAVTASVGRVDAMLQTVNTARTVADQYNPANAKRHLALLHWAATAARAWENAADNLRRVAEDNIRDNGEVAAACATAASSVSKALARPSQATRGTATAALTRLDTLVSALATSGAFENHESGGSAGVLFHLLSAELALSHLLEAVDKLDAELADQNGAIG